MTALYAEFTALEGQERAVAALVAALTVDVRAEEGCVVFDPFTRADNPRAYVVFEVYRDAAAFEVHLGSLHCHRFNAALRGLVEGGASTLERLDPVA